MFSLTPRSPRHTWLLAPNHYRELATRYIRQQEMMRTRAHKPKAFGWWDASDSEISEMEESRALQRDDRAPGLAFLEVKGVIYHGATPTEECYYDCYNLERLMTACREVLADPSIKLLAIQMESPGGYSTAVKETAELISKVRASGKPVLVYTTYCGSAAYWLAAAATAIHASPFADVGSIGVYTVLVDDVEMFKKWGLSIEYIRDGKYKAMGAQGKPWTDDERALIQAGVDRCSRDFKGFVRSQRPLITDEQMQGQVFTAADPEAAGLTDYTTFSQWEDFILYAATAASAL